jgi:hypothetical protein
MYVGIVVGLPPVIIPLLFPAAADKHLPVLQRYITKVTLKFSPQQSSPIHASVH